MTDSGSYRCSELVLKSIHCLEQQSLLCPLDRLGPMYGFHYGEIADYQQQRRKMLKKPLAGLSRKTTSLEAYRIPCLRLASGELEILDDH